MPQVATLQHTSVPPPPLMQLPLAHWVPAVHAMPDEQRDLIAWLSRLGGAGGAITGTVARPAESEFEALLHPGTMFAHPRDVISHPKIS